jgi:hypothetical protein
MDEKTKRTVKDAAGKLTGAKRREFIARVTSERMHGKLNGKRGGEGKTSKKDC